MTREDEPTFDDLVELAKLFQESAPQKHRGRREFWKRMSKRISTTKLEREARAITRGFHLPPGVHELD